MEQNDDTKPTNEGRSFSPEFYRTLAQEANKAGETDIALRYASYANEVEIYTPEQKEAYIQSRVDETIETIQRLTQWGEEEAAKYSWNPYAEKEQIERFGVLLFESIRQDIGEEVLKRIYEQLGIADQRHDPSTDTQNNTSYALHTSWGISLVETQSPLEGGYTLYELRGRKAQ